ncbi:unnamed protein product [Prunus armeniaca]|uniref:O-fucosyltransferase family protein n=1 Tax=Prunus armeniaca TaxID=36596 RepID=A0A6J5X1T2_PRUAR|nr:unnamed protein product [Prunus armeniaca]
MGKQGSPRSPRPEPQIDDDLSSGTKDYDPSNVGRRMPGGDNHLNSKMLLLHGLRNDSNSSAIRKLPVLEEEDRDAHLMKEKAPVQMYDRLLKLAKGALAEKEFKPELSTLWKEPYRQVAAWKPCRQKSFTKPRYLIILIPTSFSRKYKKGNGYIVVSANGGLNQQRVAICNAVAVASLLNATLVLPRFLYSNVWNDPRCSQFGDIYQEEHFMDVLKDEVKVVKELPSHLKSLDLEAIGSLITDADLVKEAKPIDYTTRRAPQLMHKASAKIDEV